MALSRWLFPLRSHLLILEEDKGTHGDAIQKQRYFSKVVSCNLDLPLLALHITQIMGWAGLVACAAHTLNFLYGTNYTLWFLK